MGTIDKSPDSSCTPSPMEANTSFRYGMPTPPTLVSSSNGDGEGVDIKGLGPKFDPNANLMGARGSGNAISMAETNPPNPGMLVSSSQGDGDDVHVKVQGLQCDGNANPMGARGSATPTTMANTNTHNGNSIDANSKGPDPIFELTSARLTGARGSATPNININTKAHPNTPGPSKQVLTFDSPIPSMLTFPDTTITQSQILADPLLRRMQMDLQILMSFPDNSTLHWRPTWFSRRKKHTVPRFWTLHNPPNIVTEYLPAAPAAKTSKSGTVMQSPATSVICTRRMRRAGDPEPPFIKTWAHWRRYCSMYGIPEGWLSAELIAFARLGMPKDPLTSALVSPPTHPLYPEPQPLGQGRYVLSPSSQHHLPAKFQGVDVEGKKGTREVLVVHSNGKIEVASWNEYYFHASQWTECTGRGGYRDWRPYDGDFDAVVRTQGRGRRWAWLPWSDEMEESCRDGAAEGNALQTSNGSLKVTFKAGSKEKDKVIESSPGAASDASTNSSLSLQLSPTPAAGRGKKRKRDGTS